MLECGNTIALISSLLCLYPPKSMLVEHHGSVHEAEAGEEFCLCCVPLTGRAAQVVQDLLYSDHVP